MRFGPTSLSQLQTVRLGDKSIMLKPVENIEDQGKTSMSKVDFIGLAGIGPELAEFVTEFIDRPEIFFSMSWKWRCEIENQMDAILSSFGQ
jgi:hypothetical protein